MDWDPAEDAWLSGFVDGEGCFLLATNGASISPRLSITLRADDAAVLQTLRDRFGGRLYVVDEPSGGGHAQVTWSVMHRRELPTLVTYFDRFPLRAKKANDYALWREAVGVYLAEGGTSETLAALQSALREGRAYGRREPMAVGERPQLRLVLDGS